MALASLARWPDALDRVNHGSGLIVCFSRGKGEVFHAGFTEWVAGPIRRDRAVERVTRNLLDRFLRGTRQTECSLKAGKLSASARAEWSPIKS